MKKIRGLSFVMMLMMIVTLLPMFTVGISAATAAGTLPETLPGEDVYKWGHYATASGGTPSMHYQDTALGKVDQSRAMRAETIGAKFATMPFVTTADLKSAKMGTDYAVAADNGLKIFGSGVGDATVEAFATSGGAVYNNVAGFLIRVTNLQTDCYGGMGLSMSINGKTFIPFPAGNYPQCFCHVYYYDYTKKAWYAEEPADSTNFRLAPNYDGYLYIPVESFYSGDATKTQLTPEYLVRYGVTSISMGYRWRDTGAVIQSIDAVYALPYANIAGITPTLGNDLGLAVNVRVMTEDANPDVKVEFVPEGKEAVAAEGSFDEALGLYTFNYHGIGFSHMTDKFNIVLKVNGEVRQTVENYSIQQYAETLAAQQEGAKSLAADLLYLGATMQRLTGYDTKNLATANLSEEDLATRSAAVDPSTIETPKAFTTGSDTSFRFLNCTLYNGAWVGMQVNFDAASVDGLTVTAAVGDKTYTYDKFYAIGEHYAFVFDHINPMDLGEAVTFTFNKENTGTMTYSFADVLKNDIRSTNNKKKTPASAIYNLYKNAQRCTEFLVIVSGKTVNYGIVFDDYATDEFRVAVMSFASAFRARTNAKISSKEAGLVRVNEAEIVLGVTADRPDVAAEMEKTSYTGFRTIVSGKRIIIAAYDKTSFTMAWSNIMSSLQKRGNDWVLPAYFFATDEFVKSEKFLIPKMETKRGTVSVSTWASDRNDNSMASIQNATLAEVHAYTDKLVADGYTLYDSNTILKNEYYTYCKAGSPTVHVHWLDNVSTAKVILCDESEFLPPAELGAGNVYTPVEGVKASVTQIHYIGTGAAPGMSYCLQLDDGRFMMVDGGTWEDQYQLSDLDDLYQFMKDRTPGGGTPVIACWFISHQHGDHSQLAIAFLKKYHAKIDLQMAAYNFPDFSNFSTEDNTSNFFNHLFVNEVKEYFPQAINWVVHAGQEMQIGCAKVEILNSWEQYYPNTLVQCNTTSIVWRITMDDHTILFCGDLDSEALAYVAKIYGSYLQSDIVQMAHHGYNTGYSQSYYAAADGKILLFPNYENELKSGLLKSIANRQCYGIEAKWVRGEETAAKKSYHHDSHVTVYFKDLSVDSKQNGTLTWDAN